MKTHDLFISHSAKDKEFVRKLAQDLVKSGFSVWLDEWELNLGDSIARAVSDAVMSSKFLLLVMSPDYFASSWTKAEYMAAMNEEMSKGHIKVIPLMYRDCDVPVMLRTKMWVDFRDPDNYPNSFERLVEGLNSLSPREEISAHREDEAKIGQRAEELDSATIAQLKETLKEAVEAFKTKPDPPPLQSAPVNDSRIEDNLCFIVMPFGSEELSIVYEDFIKPVLIDMCHLRCERGDDVFGSNVIMDDIRKSISKARLIIADLTGRNANVFYEVGIAHTLNKLVLLLAQSIEDVPFDLRHRRVLLYSYSPRGCKKLEKDLQANVTAILKSPTMYGQGT
jgi:hypothetical protein